MARIESSASLELQVPPVIRNYWRNTVNHTSFITNLARIQRILQDYLVDADISMEELRSTYTVDLSMAAENVRGHPGVQRAVTNVEFRENQVREILDIMYQLEGTVPDRVMEELTREDTG